MRPSAGTPGAPASPAAPGAAFRPGAPVSPDAPRGGDTSEAAPGALFRPGAPVPPSVPRTGGPAVPPPGTAGGDTPSPAPREAPGPASGEGADASRTAGEGFSSRFESGVPGGEDERSHAEGTPPLRASRIGQERDEVAVLGTTPQERRDESEDGAESDGGTPGTGHVEDEAGQRTLTAGEGGRTGDASRADDAPRAGAEGAGGARSDSRGVLASQGEDGPAETDDGGRTRRDAENAEAEAGDAEAGDAEAGDAETEAGDAEIGDAAPQAGDDASRTGRTGGEAGHDAGSAGIDDEAENGGEVRRDAGTAGATGRRATSEADPAEPAGSSESADETRHERENEIDDAAGDEVRDETGTVDGGTEAGNERTRGEDDETPDEDDETPDGKGAGTPGGRTRETPLPEAVSEALSSALTAVRTGVTDLSFGLDLPGADEARRVRSEILAQLDDYVIPRVHTSTAPALVVVAGSTGAGKSTLLNTLANAKVSATGVRRPTTGTPVLACHPDDHEWFAEGDLLGSLRRLGEPDPEGASGGLVLVSTERLPPGVALLDTPDIDSVVEEHHEIAHRMLDAADLWIFVTTAARYADAPAWRLLRLAKERGARLAIVLSRVPPRSQEVISKHFVRMLTEYGLGEVDRFVINESKVTDGMLPDHEVSELRLWLTELSVDDRRRAQAVRATLDGVLNSFRTRVPALAKQLEIQVAFRRDLRGDVDGAYARALAEIDKSTGDGSLLRGEVLARWQDFAGSGDLMRTLHLRRPSRFGGKASQQAPERLSGLKSALRAGLESVVVSAAHRAAEETSSRWLNRPGAQEALASVPGLGRASDELLRRTGRTIAAWQEHIIELIRTEGVTKRSVARVISFDVESLSLILTIGLLGYGSSDAQNGTGALPQRLVHALLGAESLRNIGVKARSDLRARIGMLFDDEMARYTQALDGAGIPDESAATRLYQATYNLEVAR
ncbi:GTPase [Streptosporangium sp. NPDC023825]|uniref:GTPase n=1 Tax=Streptosporangium sp. NPDC023825 TaxID=3154909 RepID=UPI0034458631